MKIALRHAGVVAVVIIVLVCGVLFIENEKKSVDKKQRGILLETIREISETLNLKRIDALYGDARDHDTFNYEIFKEQFVKLGSAFSAVQSLYLLGKDDNNKIFVYVDSASAGLQDESAQGSLYNKNSENIREVFGNGTADVYGPVEDRRVLSALIPVFHQNADRVSGVFGMDIEADDWEKKMLNSVLPLYVILGLFVFLGIIFYILYAGGVRVKNMGAVITFVLFFTAVIFFAFLNDQREYCRKKSDFSEVSFLMAGSLYNELAEIKDNESEFVKKFFEGSEWVAEEEFRAFTSFLAKNAAVNSWFWAQERETGIFEIQYRVNTRSRSDTEDKEIFEGPGPEKNAENFKKIFFPVLCGIKNRDYPDTLMYYHSKKNQPGVLGAEIDYDGLLKKLRSSTLYPGSKKAELYEIREGSFMLLGPRDFRGEAYNTEGFSGPGPVFDEGISAHPMFFGGRVLNLFVRDVEGVQTTGAGIITFLTGFFFAAMISFAVFLTGRRRSELIDKVAEATGKLEESRAGIASVLYSIGDGVISVNADSRITAINKAALKILEIKDREPLGEKAGDIFAVRDEKTGRTTDDFINDAMEKKEAVDTGDDLILLSSKNRLYMEAACSPVFDRYGGVPGAVIVFKDITEKKEAENEVLRHRQRLQSLVKILSAEAGTIQEFLDYALDEAVRITESKTGYIYFYDEEKEVFELNSRSKEVMKECAVTEKKTRYKLEDMGLWGEAVRQRRTVMKNDLEEPDVLKKGTPKGHIKIKKFLIIPIFGKKGKITAVVGAANKEADYNETDVLQLKLLMKTVWEITERMRAEQELKESLKKIESVFRAAPIGIGVVAGWRFTEVNNFMSEMTGYAREELLGQSALMLYPSKKEFERVGDVKYRELERTGRGMVETKWKKKDGAVIDVMLSSVLLDLNDGSGGNIFTALDVTDRKNTENRMNDVIEELQKVDIMKTNFISSVSHELRTPLTSIKGFLALLKRGAAGDVNEKQDEFLGIVEDNTERLMTLINDILDISKMESGTFTVSKKKCRIDEITEKAARDISVTAEKKGIVIKNENKGEAAAAADKGRITQVVLNLLNNAVKFSPENTQITVSAEEKTADEITERTKKRGFVPGAGKYVLVSVSDRGRGIDDKNMPELFDKFYQIHEGDFKVYKGVGLGLDISRQIVEMHDGFIWAESKGRGKGTDFMFAIPAE